MEYVARHGAELILGKAGEDGAVTIIFPVKEIIDECGNGGRFYLINRRAEDDAPYPCVITQTEDVVKWTVTSADNAQPGAGELELQYFGSANRYKSETWRTRVFEALGSGEAPAPYQAWVDEVLAAAETIEEAVIQGGFVTSVNGEYGQVVLDAKDVGAIAASYADVMDYAEEGTTDFTEAFQAAFDSGKPVFVRQDRTLYVSGEIECTGETEDGVVRTGKLVSFSMGRGYGISMGANAKFKFRYYNNMGGRLGVVENIHFVSNTGGTGTQVGTAIECIPAEDGITDTDIVITGCSFGKFDKAIDCRGRGCIVTGCIFGVVNIGISLNYTPKEGGGVGATAPWGARRYLIRNNCFDFVNYPVKSEAGSSVFGLTFTGNELMGGGRPQTVEFAGPVYGMTISSNTWNQIRNGRTIIFFQRENQPAFKVHNLIISGNTFNAWNPEMNNVAASALTTNQVAIQFFNGDIVENAVITNNSIRGTWYYAIASRNNTQLRGCIITDNALLHVALADNAAYNPIYLAGGLYCCSIRGNVWVNDAELASEPYMLRADGVNTYCDVRGNIASTGRDVYPGQFTEENHCRFDA